jgi:hypothetical protein
MQEAMLSGDGRKLNKVMRSFKKRLDRHVNRGPYGRGQRRMQDASKTAQCLLLVDCVQKMSLHDFFIYFLSDDIDIEKGEIAEDESIFQFDEGKLEEDSDGHWQFVTGKGDLMKKMATIMELADKALLDQSDDKGHCDNLLQEFHREIESEGNTVIKWEGAMVNQVCLAEGSTVFVDFESIKRVAGSTVANAVFAELMSCAVELFDKRPAGSRYENERNPFIDEGKTTLALRLPKEYNLDLFPNGPRDKHGQLLSNKGKAYKFTPLPEFMELYQSWVPEDAWNPHFYRLFDDGFNYHSNLQAECEASIKTFYKAVFLKFVEAGDISAAYPSVSIKADYIHQFGRTDSWLLRLVVDGAVPNGVAHPKCGKYYGTYSSPRQKNDQDTWWWLNVQKTPACIGASTSYCPYYAIPEGENLFNAFTDPATITKALELVFGDKPSVGFICGIKEAVVNGNEAMPGYCCLDAPYQLDEDQWGREVGYY